MIKENLLNIKARIDFICARTGRPSVGITLACVVKNRSVEEIKQALDAGITDIGENKVQEAGLHFNAIRNTRYASGLNWHMVGHLQTNKVREAVKIFALIHSVDSLRLAEEIDRQAARINKIQDILIEVNVSQEESKFGISPKELSDLVAAIRVLKNVRLLGLMAMAPATDEPQKVRVYFRQLRGLLEKVNTECRPKDALVILSMGMSHDFEVALEEGANLVRIGKAIFEV